VEEHVAALLQMYREQGFYLERIYKWAKRIGIDEIRRQIMEEPDMRAGYLARFNESQAVAQYDPWAERASKQVHAHEFTPKKLQPMEYVV